MIMDDIPTKLMALTLIWISSVSTDAFFSIAASTVAAVYFASMLKSNIVDKHYQGKWRSFFKSWFSNSK